MRWQNEKGRLNNGRTQKYGIIKKLVDNNGNKQRAAVELGCTISHVNRMINGYKEYGKIFFIHGNNKSIMDGSFWTI